MKFSEEKCLMKNGVIALGPRWLQVRIGLFAPEAPNALMLMRAWFAAARCACERRTVCCVGACL